MSDNSLSSQLEKFNKELWLLLSLFAIAALLNFIVSGQRMVLAFYTLPTVASAYIYGRRHATLTALASVLLVILLTQINPELLADSSSLIPGERWVDITVWGGTLIITGYLMGTLYEHKDSQLKELRETYDGILRNILYKAARLTEDEFKEMQLHFEKGVAMLEPVGGSLKRILPIILSHHDKYDGSGYHLTHGEEIPLEARIISVADVFDSLTSDRPYRKAMSPFEVREILTKGSGTEFDPKVVDAFLSAFRRGEMEVPALVV